MILPLAALILWLCGLLLMLRIPLCRDSEGGIPCEDISVIIPARNEEGSLPRLLRSITEHQPQPLEILVVDDGSTDATAEKAKECGAEVIESLPLPQGWRGKTWACHQGARAARGRYLLFMDADTFFIQGGLRKAAACPEGGVLSMAPYHETCRPYEELSAFFSLVMIMGTGAFTAMGDRRDPAGLFGQFMLLSSKDYREAGGHEAVRGEILENYFMARHFRRQGIPMRCRGGKGVLGIRMYPGGPRELISGWSKAFVSGAAEAPAVITGCTAAWLSGACLSFIMAALFAAGGGSLIWPVLYSLFALQIWSMLRRTGSFNPLTAAFYPLPLLFYFWVFFRALVRRKRRLPVQWKGRSIDPGEGAD